MRRRSRDHYEDADSPAECQYPMAQASAPRLRSQCAGAELSRLVAADELSHAFRYHKRLYAAAAAEVTGRWTLKIRARACLDDLTTIYPTRSW